VLHFKVANDGPDALVVHFEPLPWDVAIRPADHILIEWPESQPGPSMAALFCHEPGRLMIGEPNFLPGPGNYARVWNSAGEEITY
jgi:hypothetical protein